jgi:hypothetical protein
MASITIAVRIRGGRLLLSVNLIWKVLQEALGLGSGFKD